MLTLFSSRTGSGRCGTFIAADVLINQIENKQDLDVFNIVQSLVNQRVNMIQTLVGVNGYPAQTDQGIFNINE